MRTLVLAQSQYQQEPLARHIGCTNVRVLRNFHPTPPDCDRPARRREAGRVDREPEAAQEPRRVPAPRAPLRLPQRRAVRDGRPGARQRRRVDAADNSPRSRRRRTSSISAARPGRGERAVRERGPLVNTSDYEGFSNTFIQAWMRRVPIASLHVDPDGSRAAAASASCRTPRSSSIAHVTRADQLAREARGDRSPGARVRSRASHRVEHRGDRKAARRAADPGRERRAAARLIRHDPRPRHSDAHRRVHGRVSRQRARLAASVHAARARAPVRHRDAGCARADNRRACASRWIGAYVLFFVVLIVVMICGFVLQDVPTGAVVAGIRSS